MNWLAQKIGTLFNDPAPSAKPQTAPSPKTPPVQAPLAPEETEIHRLLDNGKTADALKAARAFVTAHPKRPGANFLFATCLDRIGRYEEAARAYRAELEINSAHEGARTRGAQVEASLVAPATDSASPERRDWRTSLPRPLMQSIQQAHLHYKYRGVPLIKNPFDLALYSQLLWELKPRTIIEIGSKHGGSAFWMGDLLNNFGIDGHIYSLDLLKVEGLSHPRVTYLEGDGRAPAGALPADLLKTLPRPWLVIEDADHEYETSIAVLNYFHPWLRAGEFIVVEDGILSDFLNDAQCNSGPHRAIKEFLQRQPGQYEIDSRYCDYFGHNLTWCTNGFLRKIADTPTPAPVAPLALQAVEPLSAKDEDEFRQIYEAIKAHTLLSRERLVSLFRLAKELCLADLPGNFVECGVAAGGSTALLAAVVARHSKQPRRVFACDSFAGLPAPGELDRHQGQPAAALGWGEGTCAAPIEQLQQVCAKLGVSHLVEPVRGFFADTLPKSREKMGPIALLHMDGDWYDSTLTILEQLYEQTVNNARIQIDDYGYWEGCQRAVEDFQRQRNLKFQLHRIDETGVWMIKTS